MSWMDDVLAFTGDDEGYRGSPNIGFSAEDFGNIDFGGLANIANIGLSAEDLGNVDFGNLGNILNIGFSAEDFGNVDFGNLGAIENLGLRAEDLGNVDFGFGGVENIGFSAEDLGNVDFGLKDLGLSYDPGEGYGTGVLPGGGSAEDIRQFFGDVSGQSTIPSWAREGVNAGSIQPNYDGTYTQIFDDGSSQTLDYTGNVVNTTTTEGLTYDKNGIITSGSRTGEKVTTSDIKGTSTTSGGGAGGGSGGGGGGKGGGGDGKGGGITNMLKDNAALIALLGGILGLLGKGGGQTGPAGYKGSIPKYTATRGTPTSPTAGGRRPGGEGIGSLTGGVSYTKAAQGGLMGLAGGGKPARYLRGGTDGMADKIETDIDGKQPARLSHGEFVIPADVVSHLGNGNSDAGADVLYDMMAKVRKARTGTSKQGKQINPRKYTPA